MNKNEFARWLPEDAPIDDPEYGTDECWEQFKLIAGCTPEECKSEHVSLLTPDQVQYLQHHNKAVKITDQCDFTIGRDNDILEQLFRLTGQPSPDDHNKSDKFVFPPDDIMWTGIPVPGMRIQVSDTDYTAIYDIRIYTDIIQQQRMRITGELPPSPYQQLHHITTPQRMIDEPLIIGSVVTQHWVNMGYRSNHLQSYGRIICPIIMMDHVVSIASSFHFTGVNEYQAAIDLRNGVIAKEEYPNVHTPIQAAKIEGSYLERFYLVFHGINLALLNPVFKVSFTNTQRTKLIQPPPSKANNKKQPIKYVRRIQINTDQFKTDIINAQQSHSSYTRKTMLWHVAGHWSTSKSGKRYFVKPHFKGPLSHNQQSIDEFTPRERIPVINPSSSK